MTAIVQFSVALIVLSTMPWEIEISKNETGFVSNLMTQFLEAPKARIKTDEMARDSPQHPLPVGVYN